MRATPMLMLGILAAACAPPSAAPAAAAPLSAAALDSVRAVDAAFAAAMNAKDSTVAAGFYAADAKLMPPDSPVLEGAAIHATLASFIAGGASNFVITPTLTYGVGDLAYQVGSATFTMGGATESVKFTEVLRRGSDGAWRYAVDMFSNVAPPAKKE